MGVKVTKQRPNSHHILRYYSRIALQRVSSRGCVHTLCTVQRHSTTRMIVAAISDKIPGPAWPRQCGRSSMAGTRQQEVGTGCQHRSVTRVSAVLRLPPRRHLRHSAPPPRRPGPARPPAAGPPPGRPVRGEGGLRGPGGQRRGRGGEAGAPGEAAGGPGSPATSGPSPAPCSVRCQAFTCQLLHHYSLNESDVFPLIVQSFTDQYYE